VRPSPPVMKISRTILFLILTICFSRLSLARAHRQRQSGKPGVFDFYVLTLSWSPEFCHSHSYSPECQSGHHGFIVHGLWPQFTEGYPENCSDAPGPTNPSEMLDIMPDEKLIQHEWTTHGTCSGLSADEYFKLLRRAYTSVKIPPQLAAPSEGSSITPSDLKEKFLEGNRSLSRESIAVSCGNNYLTGMYICLTKDLQPTSCSTLRDCRANTIKVTPVR
jgi:ribonuclease T2